MLPKLSLSANHANYLEEVRKLPSEMCAELGFASLGPNLAFDYRRNGETIFRKVRKETLDTETGKKGKTFFIEPAGAKLFLFNEDCLKEPCSQDVPLIICEGEIDVPSWMQSGATCVVSVPNGARAEVGTGDIVPEDDRAFGYLWEEAEKGWQLRADIAKFQKVIIATDGDKAGLALREELSIRIGRTKCYVVQYPEGCKDANDVCQSWPDKGQEILMNMIDRAQPLVANRLTPLMRIAERGNRIQYSTGWAKLDAHLRVLMPELIVITGEPGSGKSQFALAIMMNLARLHGLKGAILQFEDDPSRNQRDIERYGRAWKRPIGDAKGAYIDDPCAWADQMFYAISPDEDGRDDAQFDLRWLFDAITEAVVRHGCKWVLIDPWNEVEHVWAKNQSETDYTNTALRSIKRLGRRLGIAIIIVAHPSKAIEGKSIDEVNLYAVSGSSAWRNKADHGVIIMRDPEDVSKIIVKIDKSKDWSRMGVPGKITMQFAGERASFSVVGD